MKRFLAACEKKELDRPPVWIMRQAGRYLPEYQQTRKKAGSFLALCRTPELAAEVTLQPLRRFPLDAAIIFSDILLPLASLGVEFEFPEEGGPRLPAPLSSPHQWARLSLTPHWDQVACVFAAIEAVKQALPSQVALLGFCGAPWTLASYLVQGSGNREQTLAKALLFGHEAEFRTLLETLAEGMASYLQEQVKAGADAVQIFDSWAGALDEATYSRVVIPALERLLEQVKGVPRILYLGGGAHLLSAVAQLPCEVVSVDWRVSLPRAAQALSGKVIQGNLDPAVLLADEGIVQRETRQMLAQAPPVGYIANLGHGILPQTPLSSVEAFLRTIQEGV